MQKKFHLWHPVVLRELQGTC